MTTKQKNLNRIERFFQGAFGKIQGPDRFTVWVSVAYIIILTLCGVILAEVTEMLLSESYTWLYRFSLGFIGVVFFFGRKLDRLFYIKGETGWSLIIGNAGFQKNPETDEERLEPELLVDAREAYGGFLVGILPWEKAFYRVNILDAVLLRVSDTMIDGMGQPFKVTAYATGKALPGKLLNFVLRGQEDAEKNFTELYERELRAAFSAYIGESLIGNPDGLLDLTSGVNKVIIHGEKDIDEIEKRWGFAIHEQFVVSVEYVEVVADQVARIQKINKFVEFYKKVTRKDFPEELLKKMVLAESTGSDFSQILIEGNKSGEVRPNLEVRQGNRKNKQKKGGK